MPGDQFIVASVLRCLRFFETRSGDWRSPGRCALLGNVLDGKRAQRARFRPDSAPCPVARFARKVGRNALTARGGVPRWAGLQALVCNEPTSA